MKAIVVQTELENRPLAWREAPSPEYGADEVLVDIHATALNRADLMQRAGNYPPPPGAPDILGLEMAGRIAAVGSNVTGWNIGDRVCALLPGGGYAGQVAVPAPMLMPIPDDWSFEQAAAIPETFFTVWSNVFDRGRLKGGESLLVHGGSSGIGTTAIQLAREYHARVFTTAGSLEKCRACEELGAEQSINYKEKDFVTELLDATAGLGVDVILDMVAGEYINRNIKLAAEDGRIVLIAGLEGFKSEINFLPVMLKRLTITGSTLRPRKAEFKAAIAQNLKQSVWPLLEQGKVKPVIYKTFPLERAGEAHLLMESGSHIGKLVLTIE